MRVGHNNVDITKSIDAISKINEITQDMDEMRFMLTVCMTLEEWCKENNRDIREITGTILELVNKVNDELGPY